VVAGKRGGDGGIRWRWQRWWVSRWWRWMALDGVAAMMVAWCSVGDRREGDGDEGMKMMTR
ncbi:hypothetical protein Tco_0083120, partial [Tanacetum coccineum]